MGRVDRFVSLLRLSVDASSKSNMMEHNSSFFLKSSSRFVDGVSLRDTNSCSTTSFPLLCEFLRLVSAAFGMAISDLPTDMIFELVSLSLSFQRQIQTK